MFRVEADQIIYSDGTKEYVFPAHAEHARPSLLGLGISAGGRHWSSRDPEIRLEKHVSVQDAAACDTYIAWYVQEFVPDEPDYRLTKNARIYLGDLRTGEDRLIYKGECYGDLCFYQNTLYFNQGNKLAVFNLETNETTVLFRHSGIKKNGLSLHITDRRIFYVHWTHSDNHFMWYDRETKETVNPHADGGKLFYLSDDTIIYHGVSHTWLLDAGTCKKKRFFSAKDLKTVCRVLCDAAGVPAAPYELRTEARLERFDGKRLYFAACMYYCTDRETWWADKAAAAANGLPAYIYADFSCLTDGSDIRAEACREELRIETDTGGIQTYIMRKPDQNGR